MMSLLPPQKTYGQRLPLWELAARAAAGDLGQATAQDLNSDQVMQGFFGLLGGERPKDIQRPRTAYPMMLPP